jgi:hypothetical protein
LDAVRKINMLLAISVNLGYKNDVCSIFNEKFILEQMKNWDFENGCEKKIIWS